MIYPNESFYVISGLFPSSHVAPTSRYNFSIGLDVNFAKKLFEKELTEKFYETINDIGKKIISKTGLVNKEHLIKTPFSFVENKDGKFTSLLRSVEVPGNACDLSIDGREYGELMKGNFERNFLEYGAHNIDSSLQAYNLLSLWLSWADFAFPIFKD